MTRIFLDSGDPEETKAAIAALGFLDGQTTNPSLVAKNPDTAGKKFSQIELFNFYKQIVQNVSALIPQGSVSVEVYADQKTTAENMLKQAREFNTWIPNAHIKYPTTLEGLKAAEISVKEGMRVNMTLVFSQSQAAAVYAATQGAKKGQVFVSPFVGRLDDIGQNGMDLIKNILEMYEQGDGHVEVLSASIRSLEHFTKTLELGCDIITAPLKAIREWVGAGKPETSTELKSNLKNVSFQEISLTQHWQSYDIRHELTDKGLTRFAQDWNNLIK